MGGMFTPFFRSGPVKDLGDVKKSDTKAYAAFFNGMREQGIYLPPSQFEVGFISSAHTRADITDFTRKAEIVMQQIRTGTAQ
jgi:glutamate-1-semialdehyde 2,1-aminomutase